ncbi:MAG: hypothetical protein QM771_11415 [Nitrospira sp.]
MEHIAALLFVVGCSSTMTDCRELQVPVSVFETAEACVAERPFALGDLQGQAPRNHRQMPDGRSGARGRLRSDRVEREV